MPQNTLTLVDGSGYIFRAYHALPPLSAPDGTPVGAVYGFVTMLLRLLNQSDGGRVLVVFDAGRNTFRNRLYPEYKAHRPPPPEDLVPQFARVREAADALGVPRVEREDFEADDLIAAYARAAREAGLEVVVVSSDKDLMQLIGEGVSLFDPVKQKPIGAPEVLEKFGVTPDRVRDVLALIGDSSDNVPGVPGIGPKTAAELIGAYGSLEALLSRLEEVKQPKRRESLRENAEKARLSYRLIGLDDHAPLPLPLDAIERKEDAGALAEFLARHGFRSLMTRLGLSGNSPPAATTSAATDSPHPADVKTDYELVQDEQSLRRWIAEACAAGIIGFDTETTGLNAMQAELVGISLALAPGRACYIPVGHVGAAQAAENNDLFGAPSPLSPQPSALPSQIPLKTVLSALTPLLADESVLKVGHNIKYDMLILHRYGCEIVGLEDTMLLSCLLGAGLHGHGLDELCELHFGHKNISYDEVTGTGKSRISFAEVPLEKALAYAAEDADMTLRLYRLLKPRVAAARLLSLYETEERPLVPVVVAMESRGIRVDAQALKSLASDFALKMHALEQEIHALAGQPFNVGSPKQLGEVLFDSMGLPGGKKSSKTGAWSTDNQVLEELAEQGHALPEKIIAWRQLAKLKSTYADALVAQIHPETGRVHTSFSLAGTSTGRLSSSDPNLQNIPIRTEEGRKIRKAFIAAEGCRLISADYSQIELRLLAHMADIGPLRAAFRNGDDIHAITASQMFGVSVSEVNAELRRRAKTINFGIIYGISAHGLATRLGISRGEAAQFIELYFRQYPGIRDYMEAAKSFARAHGYVKTLYGRRCHVPGINDKNPARRQFSERAAINAPLQGTAADIIKRAMVTIHADKRLNLLLQVHDELVFEAPEAETEEAMRRIRPAMEHAASLSVPLTVEIGAGVHWGEAH